MPLQDLEVGLLIDADHYRVVRRRQVQAHDVADLGLQLRVGAELERLDPVRLEVPLAPDPGDPHIRDAQLGGQQPTRPVRHPQPRRRRFQRRQHHRDLIDLRRATRLLPVRQAADPFGGIPLLPRDHRRAPGP